MMFADNLRKSVLQAAVQGQLTEQLPSDGYAFDLLKKIRAEKAKLIKAKKIKPVTFPPISDDELPFQIPANWCWARLGDVCQMFTGNSISESEKKEKYFGRKIGLDFIATKDISFDNRVNYDNGVKIPSDNKFKVAKCNSVLMCIEGGSAGRKIAIIDRDVCFGNKLCNFNVYQISSQYLYFYLQCSAFRKFFFDKVVGIIGGVGINKLRNIPIPLPPLAEQERIVAKLDELLAEIELLAADERELAELEKNFPRQMKNSLLQAAVQGQLTEQLPTDGNALDLLKKIRAEKAKLIKAKKIKPVTLPPISDDELPFNIPANWCWVRLGDVCEYLQRGKSPTYSLEKKYPVISQKCNQPSGLTLEFAKFISADSLKYYDDKKFLHDGDLLWNSTGLGTVGRIGIYEKLKNPYELAVADSHLTVIRTLNHFILYKFLYFYIASPIIQSKIPNMVTGSTKQKELNLQTIQKLLVPLPPLAEQERIVAKLDEMLALCSDA